MVPPPSFPIVSAQMGPEGCSATIGIVDEDWNLEHICVGVSALLGSAPSTLRGRHLPDLLHPEDMGKLLAALGNALDVACKTLVVRLRCADGTWRQTCLMVSALEGRPPPSFGFVAVSADLAPAVGVSEKLSEVGNYLSQIATELQSVHTLSEFMTPPVEGLPELRGLPPRQLEVLRRLLSGQRVPTIAREMFLSEKTVRNHLGVVYAKLGVHSQREVLELFAGRSAASA